MPVLGRITSQLFTAITKAEGAGGVLLLHTLNNPNAYGTVVNDFFSDRSVAISGNYAIVGAWSEDDAGGLNSGKAYIYNVTTGMLIHTLNNPNPGGIAGTGPTVAASDQFGYSVAISGNYAIVGANQEDDAGADSGKAYIYNVITGALIHTLTNPNAYATSASDYFGESVAISGNYAIVGAYGEEPPSGNVSGYAYIFNVTTGALVHSLDNPNAFGTPVGDFFGRAVAISGNYAIVGAYGEDEADAVPFGDNSGKAYIFNVTTGALLFTLNNPNAYDTKINDQFGWSVAISGNYAIVSATGEDDVGGTGSGKAYIFDVTTGMLVHTLNNPNAYGTSASDNFGYSVAISDNYAIVGARNEDDAGGLNSGKAYLYSVATGAQIHTLNNPNPYGTSAGDQFGFSVAISGNYAIVGAYGEDEAAIDGGTRITVNEAVPTNGTTGLTSLFNGNSDDSFVTVNLPFNIVFLGVTYNQLFVDTNGFISFGSGDGRAFGRTANRGNSPSLPHLGFFKGDKALRILHGGVVTAGVYTLRWEGNNSGGNANRTIVEMRWFENSAAHQVRYTTNANGATYLEIGDGNDTTPFVSLAVSTLQGYDIFTTGIATSTGLDSGRAYIYNIPANT